ncbi:MAG: DUF4412 domain-containing protein [Bacteroidia bacterium]
MKNLFLSSLLIIAATAASAQTGAQVDFKISSSMGASGTIRGYYSGGNSRVEMTMNIPQMPGGGFNRTSIVKSEEPLKSYQLDDKSKTYTVVTAPAPSKESADEYTVKVIGKDKVAGYGCIHVQVTKKGEVSEYWTTKEIAEYEQYAGKGDNKYMGSSSMYEALKKQNADGFIIKSYMKDPRGGDFTMELVKIEKKELAKALFTIPADYKLNQNAAIAPGNPAQNIDIQKIQNMTPEERAKYIEEMKKQYGTQPAQPTPPKQN